jgi:GNAT superfamily N-acetyltransferase
VLRSPVTVRDAVPADAPLLLALLADPDGSPVHSDVVRLDRRDAPESAVTEAAAAVARTAADPDERLIVGLVDDEVVGVAHLIRAPLSPIRVQEAVRISALCVAPDRRGKGVGTALTSAAAAWAEEKDAGFVMVTMPARDREANRYLTRLGFSQVGVVRLASTRALRSRFTGMAAGSRDTGRMIAVRKTLRRRHPHAAGVTSALRETADPASI